MPLSIGPLESYIPGSTTVDGTQSSNFGEQEQVSVSLTPSDLWLVDDSMLNLQEIDSAPILASADSQIYDPVVQLSGEGTYDSSSPILLSTEGAYTSPLPGAPTAQTDSTVQLSGITTQSSASGSDYSSLDGSFGSSSTIITYSGSSFGSGSSSIPSLGGGLTSSTDSGTLTSGLTTTDSPGSGIPGSPTSTDLPPSGSTSDPGLIPPDPVPVPYEFHSAIALLIFGSLIRRKYFPF